MNSLNRIMSYDKNKTVNQENCDCIEFTNVKVENQIVEYPPLSDEEIEQIIKERYDYKDEKTKNFIRKALKKHGDKYNYSNVSYVNNHTHVIIICNNHDEPYEFLQIPNNHLRGARCCICYGNKKSTTEEFIKKSNDVHGVGTYDYSKVEYVGNHKNVIIICPKHGEFSQTPNNHLRGHGCMICSGKQALTTEDFIKRAKEIHGDLYDYSKVEYKNGKTKVCIICKNHDKSYEFYQNPNEHIQQKQGCPLCSGNKKSTTEEFIEKSNKIHGKGTYDYSKVNYINAFVKVVIICPKHGEFLQTPNKHLLKRGCPLCRYEKSAKKLKMTLEEFIKRAKEIHGDLYDYSKVEYKNANTNIIIICSKHGEFTQKPIHHLRRTGCPKCNKNKGEEVIRKFLTSHNIEFEEQKTFEECKNINLLKFDFYLPKYNLCIESDGSPHYQKINWNGKMTDDEMEENLKLNQKRDNIKNEYCKKNGIGLLRVNNLKAVKELTEYFQTCGIIKEQTIFDLVS